MSYYIDCFLYYIITILTYILFSRFVASLTPGERSSGSIGHKDLSHKRKSNTMNGGGQGC